MADEKELYIGWLNDARTMEINRAATFEAYAKEAAHEELQAKLREYMEITRRHAELIAACIERNGGSVSGVKDFVAKAAGDIGGLGARMEGHDALVKKVRGGYADAQEAIAAYTIIQSAAEMRGDEETESLCADILDDEIDMANWFLDYLPQSVEEVLQEHRGDGDEGGFSTTDVFPRRGRGAPHSGPVRTGGLRGG